MMRNVASTLVAVAEIVLCLSIFGPQPLAWLWVGSQVEAAGSLSSGLAVAFIGTVSTIIATVWLGKRLERVWATLHPQAAAEGRVGLFETAFVISTVLAVVGFAIWFFIFAGPGPTIAPDLQ
ncbi:MAG TPA: hypothetical protein VHF58_04090 [Solirubrobacterales bacterium]|nr:hypothetical protein [Solirubrobacterales bacterium]